ncbi:hypothetical protein Tco_1490203 [Tanacetum coccineum]
MRILIPGLNTRTERVGVAFSIYVICFTLHSFASDCLFVLWRDGLIYIYPCFGSIKVKTIKRECAEGEAKLLENIVGRTVLLLLIVPAHAEEELEASIDRIFSDDVCREQTDSAEVGTTTIKQTVTVADTVVENVAIKKTRRQKKKRYAAVDAGEASHHANKLRSDHGTVSGVTPPKITYNAAEYQMGCYFVIHSNRYKRTTSRCRLKNNIVDLIKNLNFIIHLSHNLHHNEKLECKDSNAHQIVQASNSPEKNMLKSVNIKVGEFIN